MIEILFKNLKLILKNEYILDIVDSMWVLVFVCIDIMY